MAKSNGQQQTPEVCGIILAGGRSRRMGQPKQTLPWPDADQGIIDWQTHARRRLKAVCGQVRVSGAEDLPDEVSGQPGPLAGIAAALAACPGQHCLFLPVDMPLVTTAELGPLSAVETPHAAYHDSLFPLCLTADAGTLARVLEQLARPEPSQRSVHGLLHELGPAVTWLHGPGERLQNINSPQELARLMPHANACADTLTGEHQS